MENEDDNKTFGIGLKLCKRQYRNLSYHRTLCSVDSKVQTKEPFMDMYKVSMATFLNALTFPDKTVYPVSSRNEKDFENLMDVYLNAVFIL